MGIHTPQWAEPKFNQYENRTDRIQHCGVQVVETSATNLCRTQLKLFTIKNGSPILVFFCNHPKNGIHTL